jgi:hypothetical protein
VTITVVMVSAEEVCKGVGVTGIVMVIPEEDPVPVGWTPED